jgi:hypothetical protein
MTVQWQVNAEMRWIGVQNPFFRNFDLGPKVERALTDATKWTGIKPLLVDRI